MRQMRERISPSAVFQKQRRQVAISSGVPGKRFLLVGVEVIATLYIVNNGYI
jgi:hypothetical protein